MSGYLETVRRYLLNAEGRFSRTCFQFPVWGGSTGTRSGSNGFVKTVLVGRLPDGASATAAAYRADAVRKPDLRRNCLVLYTNRERATERGIPVTAVIHGLCGWPSESGAGVDYSPPPLHRRGSRWHNVNFVGMPAGLCIQPALSDTILVVNFDAAASTAGIQHDVTGRADDTMNIAGRRVTAPEIEEVVVEHPDVSEAAVIPVPDERKGQVPVVFVTRRTGTREDSDRLETQIHERVAEGLGTPYRPAAVYIVSALPRTQTGKIPRNVIEAVYLGRSIGDVSTLDRAEVLDEFPRRDGS